MPILVSGEYDFTKHMFFYSNIEPIYFLLPFIGFTIGLFGTMAGGGGGFFFLPLLTLLIGAPAQTAVITSLVATLPICIAGTYGHYRKRNIDFRIGALFIIAGIIGAFIGAGITGMISTHQLKIAFGIYSVLIAVNMVLSAKKNNQPTHENGMQRKKRASKIVRSSFFGLFAGTITGTFGTSGTAPVLAGLFTMRIPLKMVIGTSLMVVLVNTTFAIGAHLLVGKTDLTLVYFLTSGSIAGALLGPKLLAKIKTDNSENKVRYIYALVMVLIGLLMIIR